jgi:ABC-type proline/glycine betaine transport system ATPase subunit
MMLVTHDLDSARKIADRIYLIQDGTAKRIKNDSLDLLFQED